jgi:hypothetical protein
VTAALDSAQSTLHIKRKLKADTTMTFPTRSAELRADRIAVTATLRIKRMSFEHKTTTELLRIVKAGLGFTLRTNQLSAEDLQQIQSAALKSGARITLIKAIDNDPGHLQNVSAKPVTRADEPLDSHRPI